MIKKLIFLGSLIFPSAFLYAGEQPHYQVPDPSINENTRDLSYNLDQHRHLGTDGSTALATNDATTGYYLAGQGVGIPPIWKSTTTLNTGKILQVLLFTASSSSSTTVNVFVPSGLTGTITPTSSTSKILIWVSATFVNNRPDLTIASYTLHRNGTTELGNAGNGMIALTGAAYATGLLTVPGSLCYLDSPNTTSATTYAVYMTSSNNANSIGIGKANDQQDMVLAEVGQ